MTAAKKLARREPEPLAAADIVWYSMRREGIRDGV